MSYFKQFVDTTSISLFVSIGAPFIDRYIRAEYPEYDVLINIFGPFFYLSTFVLFLNLFGSPVDPAAVLSNSIVGVERLGAGIRRYFFMVLVGIECGILCFFLNREYGIPFNIAHPSLKFAAQTSFAVELIATFFVAWSLGCTRKNAKVTNPDSSLLHCALFSQVVNVAKPYVVGRPQLNSNLTFNSLGFKVAQFVTSKGLVNITNCDTWREFIEDPIVQVLCLSLIANMAGHLIAAILVERRQIAKNFLVSTSKSISKKERITRRSSKYDDVDESSLQKRSHSRSRSTARKSVLNVSDAQKGVDFIHTSAVDTGVETAATLRK